MSTQIIRVATASDFERVLPLLRMRHTENGAHRGVFDEDLVRARFHDMSDGYGSGIVGVIEGPACIEATIGLVVATFWDTRDRHLEDLWNFVHPDYRRSDHAKRLVAFAKQIANRLGLPLIQGQEDTPETSQKVKLLERHMPRAGVIFRYMPEVAHA